MKILFVQDYIYLGNSTNIKLTEEIAQKLTDNGHEVSYLRNCEDGAFCAENVYCFTSYKDKTLYDVVKKARNESKNTFGITLDIIKNKTAFINLFYTIVFKKSYIEKVLTKEIEKVCQKKYFDVVVATACPYYTVFALANSKIKSKKAAYLLDPYSTNKSMSYAVSKKREVELYNNIDMAIITNLMMAENKNSHISAFKHKMAQLDFPAIKKPPAFTSKVNFLNNNKINCVFVGGLYPEIRNPEYILKLFTKLDKELCLSIIGGGKEGFAPGFFSNFKNILNNRLILKNAVEPDVAQHILHSADFLINIGNSISNQLPSKVFEYISTGKPILNVYKIDNCPSLKYFNKYPLALNVKEGDFSKATIDKVNVFCKNNLGKQLDFANINKQFYFATPDSVAKKFEDILKEVALS